MAAQPTDGNGWHPAFRITVRVDQELLARLDAYCRVVNRSRTAGVRHLLAVALRHYEEAMDAEDTRPR